jgi:membrane protein
MERSSDARNRYNPDMAESPSAAPRTASSGRIRPLAVLRDAARGWSEHQTGLIASTLAFYTVLSTGPLLLLTAAVAKRLVGREHAREGIREGIRTVMGGPGGEALADFMTGAKIDPDPWMATTVGVLVLVYAASRLFVVLRRALNIVFDHEPSESRVARILDVLLHQGFGVAMVAGALALWFAGLLASLGLAAAETFLRDHSPAALRLVGTLHLGLSVVLPTIAFAVLYRLAPRVPVRWAHAWIGAAIAATLLAAGQRALGVVVVRWTIPSIFGAAGSLILVLIWYQLTWSLFLLGAEVTRAIEDSRN